jgi:hypothetical protein
MQYVLIMYLFEFIDANIYFLEENLIKIKYDVDEPIKLRTYWLYSYSPQ